MFTKQIKIDWKSLSKDYYNPIKTNSAFNGNYLEYKSNRQRQIIINKRISWYNKIIFKRYNKGS